MEQVFISFPKEELINLISSSVKQALAENNQQPIPEPQEEYFDISGLAKFLNCSLPTIHKYKKMGMPFYRVGRKVLFKKNEVLDFMKTKKKG